MFEIYDETETPKEEACLRYMVNRNRQKNEPESPKEGVCLRYKMSRYHQKRGRV